MWQGRPNKKTISRYFRILEIILLVEFTVKTATF